VIGQRELTVTLVGDIASVYQMFFDIGEPQDACMMRNRFFCEEL